MEFSIVIPVYNAEKYLDECINSVLNQSYKNLELILIDDGSKDKSYEICKKYEKMDDRVKVYHNGNHGVSYTRNYGLQKVNGNYVTFLDSDDYLDVSFLSETKDVLDASNSDMIIFNLEYFDEKRKYIFYENMETTDYDSKKIDDIIDSTISINFANDYNSGIYGPTRCIGGKIYNVELLRKHDIKFVDKIYIMEDAIFNIEVYKQSSKISFVNKPLYKYRQLGTSTSGRFNVDQLQQYDYIYDKLKEVVVVNEREKAINMCKFENVLTYISRIQMYYNFSYANFKKCLYNDLKIKNYDVLFKNIPFKKLSKRESLKLFLMKYKMYFLLFLITNIRNSMR